MTDVIDGDTFFVEDANNERIKIRLYGIDAPERKQAYGGMATRFVIENIVYSHIEIKPMHTNYYGRLVAKVFLAKGESLQEKLLKAGLAWVWPRYCKPCTYWKTLQQKAQIQKIGLWKSTDAMSPWQWRRAR